MQVIAIDLVLAGENAVVIGFAAAGLKASQRRKAMVVDILAATVLSMPLPLHQGFLAVDLQGPSEASANRTIASLKQGSEQEQSEIVR